MARVTSELPERLLSALHAGRPALLLTNGGDGFPAAAYTWALALDARTVRFGADHGSSSLANLERVRQAALHVAAEQGLLYLLKGGAAQIRPSLLAARRFSIALWELCVTEVRDQSWPGVQLQPLVYEWAPALREEMRALEQAVYAEMRAARP